MASSSDNSREQLAGDPDVAESKPLRTFILEVSASRPHGVADATDVQIRVDRAAAPTKQRARSRRQVPAEGIPAVTTKQASRETPSRVAPTRSKPAASRQPVIRAPAPRRRLPGRNVLPVWAANAGFHLTLVVALAIGKLPGLERLDELLWATAPALEDVAFTDVNFESADENVSVEEDSPSELIDPGQAAFGELDSAAALADVGGEPTLPAGSLGGIGSLFGESGAGLATFGSGLGDAPTAQFFGMKIEGRRIVFVLDNSGSMQGGRLETVIAELLRCVDSLRQDQEFYVIFHSDMVYPMLYPDPVDRYLRPTGANKRLLARWLDTIELCYGDSVDEALAATEMIEPDTVFLLSDGQIHSEKTMRFLLASDRRNFPVHTFAVGMGSSAAGRRKLADIAHAHGGDFRESKITDEMKELASEQLRPYHLRGEPGPIWGRKIKPSQNRKRE